jgi:heptosyltransferase-2
VAPGERIVAIHPFCANQARAWHEDGFVATANALQERIGVRILLLGGKRDREMAAGIAGRIRPAPVTAVGETDLRQSMALLSKCALLICNDSGIMHLAAALDLPLIALFGPQSPVKFGPWGKRCRVLYKRFPCSPCRQRFFEECDPSPRGKPMCMETISVDEVIGNAQALLAGVPG